MSEGLSIYSAHAANALAAHVPLRQIIEAQASIIDAEGIPLQSDRTPVGNPDIDFEYAACPFANSPSRYPAGQPHETPVSNLERRRLRQSYAGIRAGVLAMREAYIETFGPQFNVNADHLRIADGINILTALQYLPSYVACRADNPVPMAGVIPPRLIVGSNAASGGIAALGAYAKGRIGLPFPEGREALECVEQEGSMVGHKTVCAAAPRMITDYLDLLRLGSDDISHGDIETETDGLLSNDEFTTASKFGLQMETVLSLQSQLRGAHETAMQGLRHYQPGKHNPRRLRLIREVFHESLLPIVAGAQILSNGINLCLGRTIAKDDSLLAGFNAHIQPNAYTVAKAKHIQL